MRIHQTPRIQKSWKYDWRYEAAVDGNAAVEQEFVEYATGVLQLLTTCDCVELVNIPTTPRHLLYWLLHKSDKKLGLTVYTDQQGLRITKVSVIR